MRGADRDRRCDLKDVLRDDLWGRVHFEAIDDRGVVPGVHVRGGASVSASELELDRRGVAGRVAHRGRVLHRDLGGVRGGGQAAERQLQPGPVQDGNFQDF